MKNIVRPRPRPADDLPTKSSHIILTPAHKKTAPAANCFALASGEHHCSSPPARPADDPLATRPHRFEQNSAPAAGCFALALEENHREHARARTCARLHSKRTKSFAVEGARRSFLLRVRCSLCPRRQPGRPLTLIRNCGAEVHIFMDDSDDFEGLGVGRPVGRPVRPMRPVRPVGHPRGP